MRLGRYLTESGMGGYHEYSKPRSKVIPFAEAAQLALDYHSDALDGTTIYRRPWTDGDYIYTDPSKGTRVSANVPNYYTLIIDNHPAWKKFPKRGKSVICSTSREYSEYILLPEDGSKIGICPTFDIWNSFQKTGIDSLDIWSYDFEAILGNRGFDKSWNSLKKAIGIVTKRKNWVANSIQRLITNPTVYNDWIREFFNSDKEDFLKYVRGLFDPKENGFKLAKSGDNLPAEKELWTDGKCLLIRSGVYEEFINKVFI